MAIAAAVVAHKEVAEDEGASADERREAAAKMTELVDELNSVTRRLQRRVLEQKRQQIYADGQRALSNLSAEEFRERKAVQDLGMLTRVEMVAKYAVGAAPRRISRYVEGGGGTFEPEPAPTSEEAAATAAQSSADRAQRLQQRRVSRARALGVEAADLVTAELATEAVSTEVVVDAAGAVARDEGGAVAAAEVALVAEEVVLQAEGAAQSEALSVAVLAVPVAPQVGGTTRVEKRRADDELLVLFEAQQRDGGVSREAFARSSGLPLGTLDGILARARKRQRATSGA